jgi:hypothetical protein
MTGQGGFPEFAIATKPAYLAAMSLRERTRAPGLGQICLDTASKLDRSEKIDVRYARKARALRKRT